jgi:hypothetical protein
MNESKIIIEEVNDPAEVARVHAVHEQGKRNSEWLQAHWADVLPQARGKFLAVAGQEAHIADALDAAWAWVEATHPDDRGAILQYVPKEGGPRIYGHRGRVVGL